MDLCKSDKRKDTNKSVDNQEDDSSSDSVNIESEIYTSTTFCQHCLTNKVKDSAIKVYMGYNLPMLFSKDIA